jgi:hypothetical protein
MKTEAARYKRPGCYYEQLGPVFRAERQAGHKTRSCSFSLLAKR